MRVSIISYILLLSLSISFTFQSDFEKAPGKIITHTIKEDSVEYKLFQVIDTMGYPVYYYRNIEAFPCQAENVCKLMKVRIYWDIQGNYLQYELVDGEGLTKLGHKEFADKDYNKLHKILGDANSGLRFCKYESLTAREAEKKFHSVDAVSGATSANLSFDYINGAVKTTYSLWKLANGNTKNEIVDLTKKILEGFGLTKKNESHSSNSELWNVYLADKTNIVALYQLAYSKEQLEDVLAGSISKELANTTGVTFFLLLQTLSKNKKLPKIATENLAEQLESKSYFNYVLVYNYFLRRANRKYIKKKNILYKNVKL